VFWISAAALGFEVVLMRLLLIASWYHFAFLVISIVLLGFGASGTALTVFRRLAIRRPRGLLFLLALLTCATMPLSWAIVQHVPIESRFVPTLIWQQLGAWLVFWAVLAVPFLLAAAVIGLALMTAGRRLPSVYGANLLGSGVGALLAPATMHFVPPEWLPTAMAAVALIGAGSVRLRPPVRMTGLAMTVTIVLMTSAADPPRIRMDEFKYGAHLERLEQQAAAEQLARRYSPRAEIRLYRSAMLHDLPFLSIGEAPPPLDVFVIDGHWAGSVLRVDQPEDAAIVEQSLMSFPYELIDRGPRVALLGEIGGANAWLAVRHDGSAIDVVQPFEHVTELMRSTPGADGGAVLAQPAVRTVTAEPRHFVEHTDDAYDIVQLVQLESSAAGSGGIGGLAHDFLLTRQGVGSCIDALSRDGMLFACRGIQTPPRDNIKLLATIAAALRVRGIKEPGDHVVVVRDYLAVCTIVKRSPWSDEELAEVRKRVAARGLTPVWWRGIDPELLNRPDALPQPPGDRGDWYHYAAAQLFSAHADAFVDAWAFDLRPPTDDRPFFFDFCKLSAIGALREAFGDLWLTRTEVALLFVIVAAMAIVVAGGMLILAPLPWVRDVHIRFGRTAVIVYFTALGLGYLLIELTFLMHLTRMIGDPVLSAAVTIAGFLAFSGAGSMTAPRLASTSDAGVRRLICGLAVIAALLLLASGPIVSASGALPTAARCAAALVMIAPLAFLMGFPMPLGLARLEGAAASAVPWAWGINGFASVLASPLSMIIGMMWGFALVGGAGVAMYLIAAITFARLPHLRR
jgi:hypothetical protein